MLLAYCRQTNTKGKEEIYTKIQHIFLLCGMAMQVLAELAVYMDETKWRYQKGHSIELPGLTSSLQSKFHSSGIQEIKEHVLGIIAQEECYLAF